MRSALLRAGAGWKVTGVAAGLALLGLAASIVWREVRVAPYASPMAGAAPLAAPCTNCGSVASIRILEVPDESALAAAAVTIPAAAGSQEAPGPAGPGSPMAGGEAATRMRAAYRVTVRMDDGMFRTVSMSVPPPFVVGDRVRLVEGRLARG